MKILHKAILIVKSIPKTLYFNLKYFPIKEAIKLPVVVSHRVALQRMDGSIEIRQPVRFNMVRIGFHENPAFDQKRIRAVWNNAGRIVFGGTAYLGNGSCIANFGEVRFGDNFQMSGNSSIVCKSDISFGDDVLVGWDCTFMDGDAHKVFSGGGVQQNTNRPIKVGNKVWFGLRCLVLKGAVVPDGCVVAANSCITGKFQEQNAIIGGYPAKVLRSEIRWEG